VELLGREKRITTILWWMKDRAMKISEQDSVEDHQNADAGKDMQEVNIRKMQQEGRPEDMLE